MSDISIIVAVDENGGIGKNGTLPWSLPQDLKHFSKTTIGNGNNAVIMGRKTWLSIPENLRPLKNRLNIVLTRNEELSFPEDTIKAKSLTDALKKCTKSNEIFIIGGGSIYKEVLEKDIYDKIYLTSVKGVFNCDTSFPISLETIETKFSKSQFRFNRNPSFVPIFVPNSFMAEMYERNANPEEMQYLDMISDIIKNILLCLFL